MDKNELKSQHSDGESEAFDYRTKSDDGDGENEDDISENSEMESEDDEDSPSHPITESLINEAYEKYDDTLNKLIDNLEQAGHNRKEAKRIAHKRLLPKYTKTFRKRFGRFLLKCRNIREEPLYQAVMKTAKDLKENDEYDTDEAIKCALSKRKFLLYKEFPSDGEESDDSEDDNGNNDNE